MIKGIFKKMRRMLLTKRDAYRRKLAIARMERLGGFYNGMVSRRVLSPEKANQMLHEVVAGYESHCVIRYGLFELKAFYDQMQRGGIRDEWLRNSLEFNAGVFPVNEEGIEAFAQSYAESSKAADVIGIWLYRHGLWQEEEHAFATYAPEAQLIDLHSLEFIEQSNPWTRGLEGKRVLVVSPLVESIPAQYAKRDLLFPHNNALPEFQSLRVVPAVQSAAGSTPPFDSWTDALESMKSEMEREPFDVALIGAGAYGLPLAAHAKSLGAVGIQMAGITQLLFGIRGARWDKKWADFYNEHWVRPRESEKPPYAASVEKGCYW